MLIFAFLRHICTKLIKILCIKDYHRNKTNKKMLCRNMLTNRLDYGIIQLEYKNILTFCFQMHSTCDEHSIK